MLKPNIVHKTTKISILLCFISFVAVSFLFSDLNAQVHRKKSPYNAKLSGDLKELISSFSSLGKSFGESKGTKIKQNLDSTIRFSTKISGLGRVKVKFDKFIQPNWKATKTEANNTVADKTKLIILKGIMTSKRHKMKEVPVTATVYTTRKNQQKKLKIFLPRSKAFRGRFYTLIAVLNADDKIVSVKVKSMPGTVLFSKDFSEYEGSSDVKFKDPTKQLVFNTAPTSANLTANADGEKILEISTDADSDFFKKYGDDSNVQIASLISIASDIYERDFGMKFSIIKQNIFTSESVDPYNSSDAEELIESFRAYTLRNNHLGRADVYHLFTGKELEGRTIGIAYSGFSRNDLGVICRAGNSLSFGVTQTLNNNTIDSITLTHEVGHNFSAAHDEDGEFIMAPGLTSPPPTEFSEKSLSDISDYIDRFGNCLENSAVNPPVPTPVPTEEPTLVPTQIPTLVPTVEPTVSIPNTPVPTIIPPTSTPEPDEEVEVNIQNFNVESSISRTGSFKMSVGIEASKPFSGLGCSLKIASDIDDTIIFQQELSKPLYSLRVRSRPRVSIPNEFTEITVSIACNSKPEITKSFEIETVGRVTRSIRDEEESISSLSDWIESFTENLRTRARERDIRKRNRKKRRQKRK